METLEAVPGTGPVSNTALANYNAVRLVAQNVDWLSCSVAAELPGDFLLYLRDLLALLEPGEPGAECGLEFMGQSLIMRGGGKEYAYILHNDYLAVAIAPAEAVLCGKPAALLTIYSPAFWELGVSGAAALLQEFADTLWCRAVVLAPSRTDLCADVVGLPMPTRSEYAVWRSQFVTRARSGKTFERGDVVETVYFGSRGSAISARIYDKSAEVKRNGKDYYQATWARNGWTAGDQVTRVEFELKREFVREVEGERIERIETIHDLVALLPSIWDYLTHDWLRAVVRDPAERNVSRLDLAPWWREVRATFQSMPVEGEIRRHSERRLRADRLQAQWLGVLKSWLALIPGGSLYDLEEIVRGLLAYLQRHEREESMSFGEMVRRRQLAFGIAA